MVDIAQRTARPEPPRRPERMIELETMGAVGDAARPLTIPERLLQITGVRRMIVVAVLCIAWQLYAMYLNNSLLFPTLTETIEALYDSGVRGPLIERMLVSLQTLLIGYAAGLTIAGIFTTLAVSTRVGTDFLSTLTAMFNPLPAIALLPLALLWFGLGAKSLVFVIRHPAMWALALNTPSVFTTLAVSTRVGTDFLSTLTAMFNPLPAIALLPLALLWFGLGAKSLVFVIIHS